MAGVASRAGEGLEEGADAFVPGQCDGAKGFDRSAHGVRSCPVGRLRHVKQITRRLHHDQPVAGAESLGQFGRHARDTVAAEWDRHSGFETLEFSVSRHVRVFRAASALAHSGASG